MWNLRAPRKQKPSHATGSSPLTSRPYLPRCHTGAGGDSTNTPTHRTGVSLRGAEPQMGDTSSPGLYQAPFKAGPPRLGRAPTPGLAAPSPPR